MTCEEWGLLYCMPISLNVASLLAVHEADVIYITVDGTVIATEAATSIGEQGKKSVFDEADTANGQHQFGEQNS